MNMRSLILASFIVLVFLVPTRAEQVVFNAYPLTRVTSSADSTSRESLTESKGNEYRVIITKEGNNYLWATRENRHLLHTISGAFHLFIDSRGGGYIKIFDLDLFPKSPRDQGPRYRYMEHMTMHLGSVTYWGAAERFEP
jgi:hypothetical protein